MRSYRGPRAGNSGFAAHGFYCKNRKIPASGRDFHFITMLFKPISRPDFCLLPAAAQIPSAAVAVFGPSGPHCHNTAIKQLIATAIIQLHVRRITPLTTQLRTHQCPHYIKCSSIISSISLVSRLPSLSSYVKKTSRPGISPPIIYLATFLAYLR